MHEVLTRSVSVKLSGGGKSIGEFTLPVKLHKDVTAHLKVVIEKEAAE